jgi:DNA-binding SARP family transcriptional activator
VNISVLGPLLVVADDGVPVVQRSVVQRLLLTVLIAAGGRTVQPDELAESLWPDALPADPAGALQSQVCPGCVVSSDQPRRGSRR